MLAPVGCPFGPFGSDPRQVQSCRLTGAFARHDPPDSLTDRWIQAQAKPNLAPSALSIWNSDIHGTLKASQASGILIRVTP